MKVQKKGLIFFAGCNRMLGNKFSEFLLIKWKRPPNLDIRRSSKAKKMLQEGPDISLLALGAFCPNRFDIIT